MKIFTSTETIVLQGFKRAGYAGTKPILENYLIISKQF